MSYRKEREVMRLRHDLRRAVALGRHDQARAILADLRRFAEQDKDTASADLANECKRWDVRVKLLAS
jgi:hypothetical protein